ncbi:heat shock 70 kDa protein 12B-like isoform X2 [Dreissena polymorpha]|nr:heat shock 70 kDa protein 12B-like isoform X2 [Dreissena polymorpha]
MDIKDTKSTVRDCEGRTCPALDIYEMAIKYLLGRLMKFIRDILTNLFEESAVFFIITVPDTWGKIGKQFTLEAAVKAGINKDAVDLSFESEAAALWCINTVKEGRILQCPGHIYIVINHESDIIHITVLEATPEGNVKSAFSESCDGILVEKYFLQYFERIFGKGILQEFRKHNTMSYFDFMDYLEGKKNIDVILTQPNIVVRLPRELIEIGSTNRKRHDSSIQRDKMRIEVSDLKQWLEDGVTRLVEIIKALLIKTNQKEIQSVLLVGGIADSMFVQNELKTKLPGINVFAPNEGNWTVVKGASLFGHKTVSTNMTRTTNSKNMLPPNVISKKTTITKAKLSNKKFPVVAAFDFGTTYSGYAYSYEYNEQNIKANDTWRSNDASASLNSLKTPTTVLLDPQGHFHSFGFEAEDEFARLIEENVHDGWRLFRRFKMILHNNKDLSRYTNVEDIKGKPFPALTIFAMSIKYLREHLLKAIGRQTLGIEESDILYVLTVPAIWDVAAKQFMREAAEEAGINNDRLLLAFESEVAALWCVRHFRHDILQLIGTKYIVIDLGGGTADITVHERQPDGDVKVINQPTGGAWGGIKVDEKFFEYLEQVLGKGILEELRNTDLEDYYMLIRDFENKKRSDPIISNRFTTVRIPSSMNQIARNRQKENKTPGESKAFKADKLRIDSSIIQGWFEHTLRPLLEHIKILISQRNLADVRTIMLVGGFAESLYVQNRLKEELSGIKLIVPEEAGLAVVKGAVIFGQRPYVFASRVMSYTYGIEVYDEFDEKLHLAGKRVFVDGRWRVKNCFQPFVRANEAIPVDHCVTQYITPMAIVSLISVYRSLSVNPKYTTDPGCEYLGMLMIENPENVSFNTQEKEVSFMFGNTEILVSVKHIETGREDKLIINCL